MSELKKYIFFFAIGLLVGIGITIAIGLLLPNSSPVSVIAPVSIMTVFSPDNGEEVINLIDSAKETLDIEMYVFTSENVADALKRAKDRGVKIRMILEKRVSSDENPKHYNELKAYGISINWASKLYKLTHAKFMIVDGKKVLVGSHNFSDNALKENREASVIIEDKKTVADFVNVFERDWVLAA